MNRRNFIRMVVGGTAAVACGVTVAKEESALSRSIRENIEKRQAALNRRNLSMLRNSRFGAYGQYSFDANGKLLSDADFFYSVKKIKNSSLSGAMVRQPGRKPYI